MQGVSFGYGEVFLFGALVLLPGFIGAAVASWARVSPVIGFFIGLLGSWVGIIALYLYGHSQRRASTASPRVVTPSPEDRLRALRALLDEGLISQEEYETRRQAALDNL